jgi:hypothetical protein
VRNGLFDGVVRYFPRNLRTAASAVLFLEIFAFPFATYSVELIFPGVAGCPFTGHRIELYLSGFRIQLGEGLRFIS